MLLTNSVPWPEMGVGMTRREHSNLPAVTTVKLFRIPGALRGVEWPSASTYHTVGVMQSQAVPCFPVLLRTLNAGSSCQWEGLTRSYVSQVPVVLEHGPTCSLEFRANRGSSGFRPLWGRPTLPWKAMGFLGFCLQAASCSDVFLESCALELRVLLLCCTWAGPILLLRGHANS